MRSLFQKLAVHLVANRGNVPRLFVAKQVSRPADLQISQRDLKAGAEVSELLNRLQSLAGIRIHKSRSRKE